METATRNSCAHCERLQAQGNALSAEVASLREQLASARKNSSTSSKPPSSDIVKPRPSPPSDGGKRSLGGQPGHPKHDRQPFPPEQVSHFEEHTLDACPCCGGPLRRNAPFAKLVQAVDVVRPPLVIE